MSRFWFLPIVFMSFIFSCGSETKDVLSPPQETGTIVIHVTWPQSASAGKRAENGFQISYIAAYLYLADEEITHTALEHQENRGVAEIKVSVGEDYRLELIGYDVLYDNVRIYYVGVEEDIDVVAGEATTVDITMVDASPVLNPAEMLGENSYTFTWSSVPLATLYSLGEDKSIDFSSPTTVYTGPGTTMSVTYKTPGVYYYSVFAETPYGNTSPSDPIMVEVGGTGTISINIPWPGE